MVVAPTPPRAAVIGSFAGEYVGLRFAPTSCSAPASTRLRVVSSSFSSLPSESSWKLCGSPTATTTKKLATTG
jgi:hypothetical protein